MEFAINQIPILAFARQKNWRFILLGNLELAQNWLNIGFELGQSGHIDAKTFNHLAFAGIAAPAIAGPGGRGILVRSSGGLGGHGDNRMTGPLCMYLTSR